MSAAVARVHDVLLPQPPGGIGAGAALAVLVHVGLVAALTVSVDWRASTPDVVSAELWAAVPQVAAPQAEPVPQPTPPAPVVAPPPPPPVAAQPTEADIAIERAERRKAEDERKRAEAEAERKRERDRELAEAERKKRDKAEAAAREKAEEDRMAQQREENLRRMMGQAGGGTGAPGSTGTAARDAAPSATYAGRIVAAVRKNIVFTGAAATEATTEVEVRTAPAGTILSARIVKASGHKDWDEAVMRGLDKTAKLPPDTDGRVPSTLLLVFRPKE